MTENRIKERQLDLFADRISAATMRTNQLRLYFFVFAGFCCRLSGTSGPPGRNWHGPGTGRSA